MDEKKTKPSTPKAPPAEGETLCALCSHGLVVTERSSRMRRRRTTNEPIRVTSFIHVAYCSHPKMSAQDEPEKHELPVVNCQGFKGDPQKTSSPGSVRRRKRKR